MLMVYTLIKPDFIRSDRIVTSDNFYNSQENIMNKKAIIFMQLFAFGLAGYNPVVARTGGLGETGAIVTNCEDSGPGSFREAISYANSNPGPDTIRFQIPKNIPGFDTDIDVWVIKPESKLPTITDALYIDGFSQREFIEEDSNPYGPEIWLHGELAGLYANGFKSTAPLTDIEGLTISHFQGIGIVMEGVNGGSISGCYIGVDFRGDAGAANQDGILLSKHTRNITIASKDTDKSIISGNSYTGISMIDTCSHIHILGNIIGLNRTGTFKIGNLNSAGIKIDNQCDSVDVSDNLIGGNKFGVYIYRSQHIKIENNLIGLNEVNDEILEFGNESSAISILEGANNNNIIGNSICFNNGGVYISGEGTIRNKVSHNQISKNGWNGIWNDFGGNLELAPPVIYSASVTSVTGTAIPNASVEIYTDPESQGLIFQGEVLANASGQFTWNGTITGPYTNVTAIAIDENGNTSTFSQAAVMTDVERLHFSNIPKIFSLSQNFPNPFNPYTTISFSVPQACFVTLKIYNLLGKEVATLLRETRAAGEYSVQWNGENHAAGIYFLFMKAGDHSSSSGQGFTETRKLILQK